MITLEEAREALETDSAPWVVYVPAHGQREDGWITSVNDSYVFVRYGNDRGSKATRGENLEWPLPFRRRL